MGNMHLRVYLFLVTYMVALSACVRMASQHKQATFSSDLHTLEMSSDSQEMDINETAELEKFNGTYPSTGFRSTWPSVLGAVTAVLSIALMIAVVVKYRLFKSCLLRNTHDLLLEGDRDSQYSHNGALEGDVPVRGMRGRMIHTSEDSSGEDDDGFIEDNYIQASEREKAEQEDHQEDVEDTDDELIISESDIE
ncbi:hypothetical protein IRJ41_008992 [Triplophysa rosa]|uniref:Type III endosome membrane protein TEMP n=1 Tax=Triplophysa rosa TaxID=992332 RepID=A0A9W7WW70_TRIRA|nr:hypothetical protein IRJ41_008992 [Triplophysa rosa]